MWPIVTDRVAWSVGQSVCLSVTLVSRAKMAEPIEMPFGFWTWMGPSKPFFRSASSERGGPLWSIATLPWAVQKWLNWSICCLHCWLGRKCKFSCERWRQCTLMGGHVGATWRIRLNFYLWQWCSLMSNYFGHPFYSNSDMTITAYWCLEPT